MKLKFIAAAAVAALGLSTAAQADEGWYVLGAVGGAYVNSDLHSSAKADAREFENEYCGESTVTCSTSTTNRKSAFVGKVAMGYYFNDYFALEGGYYYLGKSNAKVSAPFSYSGRVNGKIKAKGEVSAHMLAVDAVGMLPVTDVFTVFGKLGFGVAFSKTKWSATVSAIDSENREYSFSEGDSSSKKKTRLVPKIGVGCEWTINKNVAIRAEYEGVFRVTTNTSETAKTDYHMATLGVKYMF